ncbi:DB module [Cooperia oncophora]
MVDSSSVEQDREVLMDRLRHSKRLRNEPMTASEELEVISPTVAENRRGSGPVDPNRAFLDCCIDRQLPDACLAKCNFRTYTKESLSAMYFKQDPCPLEAMKEMQFCAAQGGDHTACCARNGVTTTLAGMKCLAFCDQRLGHPRQLDMSYVPCFDRFENMKACFWHDLTRYYRSK